MSMKEEWASYEPAPIEFMHGLLMDLFHEWRIENHGRDNLKPQIDGVQFGNIIAKAKLETYKKYPKQVSSKAVLKTDI